MSQHNPDEDAHAQWLRRHIAANSSPPTWFVVAFFLALLALIAAIMYLAYVVGWVEYHPQPSRWR